MDGDGVDDAAPKLGELYLREGPSARTARWSWLLSRWPRRRCSCGRVEVDGQSAIHLRRMGSWPIITLNMYSLVGDSNESAFPIIRASHSNPSISSSKTFWFERDDGHTLSLAGRYMDHVYYSVNDNVDPVGIGRTDVVAKLLVAKDTY